MIDKAFLSTEDLCERYGVCKATIKRWRTLTRRGEPTGPIWYEVPRTASTIGQPFVRYELHQVLAWEETNSITPLNPF
jgi:hypothetical protein